MYDIRHDIGSAHVQYDESAPTCFISLSHGSVVEQVVYGQYTPADAHVFINGVPLL